MDFELSAEQKEIQALTRDFVRAEIEPHAAEWDRQHRCSNLPGEGEIDKPM